jgi:hypothetical protein
MKCVEIYAEVLKLCSASFHKFFCSMRQTRSSFTTNGQLLCSSLWAFVRSSLNILHQCLNSFFTHYILTMHNSEWISPPLMFLVWRKWITLNFTVGRFINCRTYHSVETRTNTRWPVTWWFRRQWVMWCYFTCTSSPLPYISCLK